MEYVVVGEEGHPRVVFLHGIGGSPLLLLRAFRRFARHLGVQIYAPWLPNHGGSSDAWTYQEAETMIVDWARALDLTNVRWAGHSLGAYFAAGIVADAPELVMSCAPIDPPWCAPEDCEVLPWTYVAGRLLALFLEAFALVFLTALPQSVLSGHFREFVVTQQDLLRNKPSRIIKSIQVIRTRKCYRDQINDPDIARRITPIFHKRDWLSRPPTGYLPGRAIVVEAGLHNSLFSGSGTTLVLTLRALARAFEVELPPAAPTHRRFRSRSRPA
jgi:pimeloyl-ACP methyl ester carboxylesterase